MANRPKGYGFSSEVASKIDSKYDANEEQEVVEWISAITGLAPSGKGRQVSL